MPFYKNGTLSIWKTIPRLGAICFLCLGVLSCRLGDNRINGQYRGEPSAGPLVLVSQVSSVPLSSQYQIETSGGVPPLSYEVVVGSGSVSGAGLYTAGTALEDVTVRVTDASGEFVEISFSVEAGHFTSGMIDSKDIDSHLYLASDDFSKIVYSINIDGSGYRLYSADFNGNNRVPLTPPGAGVTIYDFKFNFDQSRVIVLGDIDTVGVRELYSVAIDGSDFKKVNNPLKQPLTFVSGFAVSPVDNTVVYIADEDDVGEYDLFAVDAASPGTYTNLSTSALVGATVLAEMPLFTADGQYVVFLGQLETLGYGEVFSTLVTGGSPVKLNSTPIANVFGTYLMDVVGSTVLYASKEQQSYKQPYQATVNVAGSSTRTANINGDCYINNFQMSHDLQSYLWNCDLNHYGDLIHMQIGSSVYSEVHPTTLFSFFVSGRFNADDTYVVYSFDTGTGAPPDLNLFSVDTATFTNRVKLNSSNISNWSTFLVKGTTQVYFPSGNQIFESTINSTGENLLATLPVTGVAPIKDMFFNFDQAKIIVQTVDGGTAKHALYVIDLATSEVHRITPDDFVSGSTITWQSIVISPLSNVLLFHADRFIDEKYELFSVAF